MDRQRVASELMRNLYLFGIGICALVTVSCTSEKGQRKSMSNPKDEETNVRVVWPRPGMITLDVIPSIKDLKGLSFSSNLE